MTSAVTAPQWRRYSAAVDTLTALGKVRYEAVFEKKRVGFILKIYYM
jgi:DNA-binding transcriptional regulator of glucitol operon